MTTDFVKMHGLGNDFVVFEGPKLPTKEEIVRYCDRHKGIGADGVLVITAYTGSEFQMNYWNADGSVAEMCGNGLRCAVRFAVENNLVNAGQIRVKTDAGLLLAVWDGQDVKTIEVQVGKVQLNKSALRLHDLTFYNVHVGNPHAVTFVEDIEDAPVLSLGPKIEVDPQFPHKTNVEFVQVVSQNEIRFRVWERGVGETLACATGMVASAFVARELQGLMLPIVVTTPGGAATVWVDEDGYARMKGPAHIVFHGTM